VVQETAAAAVVASCPELLQAAVLPALRDYGEQRAHAVPSLIAVAACAALAARPPTGGSDSDPAAAQTARVDDDAWHALLRRVLHALPWCGSFVHATRTSAQLAVWHALELAPALAARNASLAAFLAFFRANHDLNRLRAVVGVETGLDAFDLARATSPRGLLLEEGALMGAAPGAAPLKGAPPALLAALEAYLAGERAVLKAAQAARLGESAAADAARRAGAAAAAPKSPPPAPRQEVWQRKVTPSDRGAAVADPWGVALGRAALAAPCATDAQEIEAAGGGRRAAGGARRAPPPPPPWSPRRAAGGGRRQGLIVVASLLDKVPNLAGLARTCEVFRELRCILLSRRETTWRRCASSCGLRS
jgi:hypothetical protein